VNQQVRFCSSFDGARIAYALSGHGAPLVLSATWLSHLEHQWRSLAWRPWLEHFSGNHALLRYDLRGTGLSDRSFLNVSLDTWVRDFAAVVDAAGFERFPLLGVCQGGPIAIAYAARHPERVSRLVLYGTYARGAKITRSCKSGPRCSSPAAASSICARTPSCSASRFRLKTSSRS
jgi:pimeloyl-ACP methyl ester carboxylesterase